MALIAKRKTRESWRDAVAARAREAGEPACLVAFDALVNAGRRDAEAAYRALATHGLLWSLVGPEQPGPPSSSGVAARNPHEVPEV